MANLANSNSAQRLTLLSSRPLVPAGEKYAVSLAGFEPEAFGARPPGVGSTTKKYKKKFRQLKQKK